jgi:hypothetical protein
VVVLEGPAGIGKTRLLAAARSAALDAGVRVLAARASEKRTARHGHLHRHRGGRRRQQDAAVDP